MADSKNDKPSAQEASMNDSGELLREVFREELDALTLDGKAKPAAKKDNMKSAVKEVKSPSQGKGAGRKKAGAQIATDKTKIVKSYPVCQVKVDKPKKITSKKDTLVKKTVEGNTAPQVKGNTREEARSEERIKITQIKGGRVGFGGNLALISDKLKVALLSVLLVAAVAFLLGSLGLVDFGQFLGLSEPTKKASNKTQVAKGPPAKASTRMTAKSTQKTTSRKASDKTTFKQRTRIVRIPSKATPSKEPSLIIKSQTKPITSTRKRVIAQRHQERSASKQESVVAKQPPKPNDSTQKQVIPKQPAKPATITQELSVNKTPAQPVGSAQKPIVAKKPLEPSAPKVQPVVVKAPSKSAEQTPEKAALAKEEVFPGEPALSYPYSIYLGSFKTHQRAERAIYGYRKKGLSPYWVKIDLGDKGVWYRVFSGYFEKREQANKFIEKKQIVGAKSRHTKYAILIGIFESPKELDKEKLRLSKLGCRPYVIPGPNTDSLLYVGAFYQKARAQIQCEELASKGIQSRVVER
jgi:hypothetical protein